MVEVQVTTLTTRKVDYDRGVVFADDPQTNLTVYEYDDDKGKFFTAQLTPVPEEIAIRALGEKHVNLSRRLRMVKESMDEHRAKIEAELEMAKDTAQVIAERGAFKVLDIGLDRYQVFAEGALLTKQPLPKDVAMKLFDGLAPPPVEEVKADDITPLKVKSLAGK